MRNAPSEHDKKRHSPATCRNRWPASGLRAAWTRCAETIRARTRADSYKYERELPPAAPTGGRAVCITVSGRSSDHGPNAVPPGSVSDLSLICAGPPDGDGFSGEKGSRGGQSRRLRCGRERPPVGTGTANHPPPCLLVTRRATWLSVWRGPTNTAARSANDILTAPWRPWHRRSMRLITLLHGLYSARNIVIPVYKATLEVATSYEFARNCAGRPAWNQRSFLLLMQ